MSNTSDPARSLLSPDELADQLGVPVRTVYGWNLKGSGPTPIRVGRHVRYRQVDVDAWLRRQEVTHGAA